MKNLINRPRIMAGVTKCVSADVAVVSCLDEKTSSGRSVFKFSWTLCSLDNLNFAFNWKRTCCCVEGADLEFWQSDWTRVAISGNWETGKLGFAVIFRQNHNLANYQPPQNEEPQKRNKFECRDIWSIKYYWVALQTPWVWTDETTEPH